MDEVKRQLVWAWRPCKKPRLASEEFFEEGEAMCNVQYKQIVDTTDDELESLNSGSSFVCQISQCSKEFDSTASYEFHYNTCHKNTCSVCRRVFPSGHLLDIHVMESHDSMFHILAAKQPMFECLVVGCGIKFKDETDRKNHLVKVHKYPANFRFQKQKEKPAKKAPKKVDPKNAMETESSHPDKKRNRKKKNKTPGGKENQDSSGPAELCGEVESRLHSDESMTVESSGASDGARNGASDGARNGALNVEQIEENNIPTEGRRLQYTYKVPKNICFGAGSQKGFQTSSSRRQRRPHWHQRKADENTGEKTEVNIEDVNMRDLATALNS